MHTIRCIINHMKMNFILWYTFSNMFRVYLNHIQGLKSFKKRSILELHLHKSPSMFCVSYVIISDGGFIIFNTARASSFFHSLNMNIHFIY